MCRTASKATIARIICLVIEPETVEPAAMDDLSARIAGARRGRLRAADSRAPTRSCGCSSGVDGFTTAEFDQLCFGEALPRPQHRSAHPRDRRAELNDFSGSKMTAADCAAIGQSVAVALPASVQGTDRHLVPRLPRLEARAASAALRQRGHQPRASRAGHRLSRFHAFQPFDPPVLRLEAARDLLGLARSRDLPQRPGDARQRRVPSGPALTARNRPIARGRKKPDDAGTHDPPQAVGIPDLNQIEG